MMNDVDDVTSQQCDIHMHDSPVICHNDLQHGNVMQMRESNDLVLLDWE